MNKALSDFILSLHRTAQQLPPHQFRDWLFEQCQHRYGISAVYWFESDRPEGDQPSDLLPDDCFIRDKSGPDALRLPHPSEELKSLPIPTVDPECLITGSEPLSLCQRQHQLTLLSEYPFDQNSRNELTHLIPHLIEAYDTSQLAYFSKIQDSNYFALLSGRGTIKHCSWHSRNRLDRFQGTIRLQPDEILFLRKYKVLRSSQLFVRTVGEYGDHLLINIEITPERLKSLTPVEFAVSYHYSRGLSYKEVAKLTDSSPSTVNNHLNRIFDKLKLNNKNKLSLEFF